jgi:hypothetical protein
LTVGTMTQASATVAVKPPSRPTMPMMVAPTEAATRSALTRFALMFFSRLPPPTENTSTPSAAVSRLAASQLANTVSQPSSLVRAVISATLSVGA